jgi:tetratricopeptide (TPR) repeat protein
MKSTGSCSKGIASRSIDHYTAEGRFRWLDPMAGDLLVSRIGPCVGGAAMPITKSRRTLSTRGSARKPILKRSANAKRRHVKAVKAETRGSTIRRAPARASAVAQDAVPAAPPRKPTYHEAVAMYERGLQALQRRDFATAAAALRSVIERYPDEQELLERARLYLKVCERELEPKEPAPKTADEWVYAATVSLNAGDAAAAVQHLQRALTTNASHDHAHYMMAVASLRRNHPEAALDHLRQAVTLNPENRGLARQDPDLDPLRDLAGFRAALDVSAAEPVASQKSVALRPRKTRR